MTDLWIATGNPKKRIELERLLEGRGFRIRTLAELDDPIEIVEDGDTFRTNAAIKALALGAVTGGLAIGDDSGLCVDALDGRPGVRSARYGGPDATDRDRIDKLLGELEGVPPEGRGAAFHCHICLADGATIVGDFEGSCRGRIAERPSGEGGFGYDPIFLPDEFRNPAPQPTFAALTPEQKDSISHRGHALRALIEHLTRMSP